MSCFAALIGDAACRSFSFTLYSGGTRGGHLIKRRVGARERGIPLREGLPAPNRRIDVEGVQFETVAAATHTLGRQDGRAGSQERIEHDVASPRAVAHGVG